MRKDTRDKTLPRELWDKRFGSTSSVKHDPVILIAKIESYTESTDYPMLKEVCGQIGINYDVLNQIRHRHEAVEHACRKLLDKAECYIERGALHKKLDAGFAQFRLKQKGFNWHDRQQIETSVVDNIDIRTVTKKELQERLKLLKEQINESED